MSVVSLIDKRTYKDIIIGHGKYCVDVIHTFSSIIIIKVMPSKLNYSTLKMSKSIYI